MKYLHTMVRVHSLEEALDFYCGKLGMVELLQAGGSLAVEEPWASMPNEGTW